MKTISMDAHDMSKQNLVTTSRGDFYKCSVCGVAGFRTSVAPLITVTEEQFKVAQKCTFVTSNKQPNSLRPSEVKVLRILDQFGIEPGVHKVVDCPASYAERYANDIWIWSEKRNEAIRLLPEEYQNA